MSKKLLEPPKYFSNLNSMKKFILSSANYHDVFAGEFFEEIRFLEKDLKKELEEEKAIELLPENTLRYLCVDASLMLYKDIKLAYNFIKGTDFDDAPLDVTMENLSKLEATLNCFPEDYYQHPRNEKELEVNLKRFDLKESFSDEVRDYNNNNNNNNNKKKIFVYSNMEKGLLLIKRTGGSPDYTLHYEVVPPRIVNEEKWFYLEGRLFHSVVDYKGTTSHIKNSEGLLSAAHISGDMRSSGGPFYRLNELEATGLKTNKIWARNGLKAAKFFKKRKYPYMRNSVFLNFESYDFNPNMKEIDRMIDKRIKALPKDIKEMIGAVK